MCELTHNKAELVRVPLGHNVRGVLERDVVQAIECAPSTAMLTLGGNEGIVNCDDV